MCCVVLIADHGQDRHFYHLVHIYSQEKHCCGWFLLVFIAVFIVSRAHGMLIGQSGCSLSLSRQ